ncbi:MAG: Ger(x)C family spore germination protein [Bacillota bacterium]
MKKKVILILIVISISIFNTGCWDLNDIDTRAIVTAIAIDFVEPIPESYYENTEMIQLTAQIAIQQKLGGGAAGQATMGEESVWNVSVVGRNVSIALMHLERILQYEVFLGHIRMLVLSEDIAREGVNRHLNYFRNDPEFRRLSYILVSKGKAEDILNTFPETATIQAIYMRDFIENEVNNDNLPKVPFYEFIVRLMDRGIDPVTILIDRRENEIKIAGLAVFRGERMIGHLNVDDTYNFTQLSEQKVARLEVVRDVRTELGGVTINFSNIKGGLRPRLNDDNSITFDYDLQMEGESVSQEIATDYQNPIFFKELENRISNEFKRENQALVYRVQNKFEADIFGFGQMVKAYYPERWSEIDDWREEFKKVDLVIRVSTEIRRIGMSTFKK